MEPNTQKNQTSQEDQTPQSAPQVHPTSEKILSVPKVILTVVLISVAVAIITVVYWFFVLGKSEPASIGPTKVSTPSAKFSTPSAQTDPKSEKQTQDSGEPDQKSKTVNWKTYTGKFIKATFKYPPTWVVAEALGVNTGEGLVNTKISLSDSANGRAFFITENFLGGFTGLQQTSEKNITIDGVATKKTYLEDELGGGIQVHIQLEKDGKNYFLIGSWADEDLGADEIIDQILATLEFLN